MSTVVEPSEPAMHAEKEPQVARREAYRVGPNGEEVLHAEITGEYCRASGDVLDLGFKRVAVSLPIEQDPVFALGERIMLTLNCETMGSASVQATIEDRTELEGCRYGVAFPNHDELRQKLGPKFMQLFKQRKTYRVEPNKEPPIDVHLSCEALQVTGTLRDLSAGGVGVLLDYAAERKLARLVAVRVTFRLPGQERPLTFEAEIRKRVTVDAEAVSYGLARTPEDTPDFSRHQDRVTDYVMARQRELLQSRAQR